MLKELAPELAGLPRPLGNGLLLRWATLEDMEAVAEFDARIHSDTETPDEGISYWVRDLFKGTHPTTGAGDFTVVVDENKGGKVVSTMNLISQVWEYEGIPFKVGRPELVGTDPEYRKLGLIRRQFEAVHARSAARGEMVQGITGIPWYYRKFGYEMALDLGGARRLFWNNVSKLGKDEQEVFKMRLATLEDIPILKRLNAIFCSQSLVSCPRTEEGWRYDLSGKNEKSLAYSRIFIIEELSGIPVGYVFTVKSLWPSSTRVTEMAVLPGYSLRAACEFLTRALKAQADELNKERDGQEKPYSTGAVFDFGKAHPVYQALRNQLEKQLKPYAWYMRVPDLPGFLRHIAPALEKRLVGSVVESHSGTLALNFYTSQINLVFEKGKLVEVKEVEAGIIESGDVLFPDLTFLQVLFGRLGLEELHETYPDCYARNERAAVLVETLFPPRPSHLTPVA